MPGLGKFVLHSSVRPDLPAGPYTVEVSQSFDVPDVDVPSLTTHIEVTAPRFTLPPDQILSTFPPNQSQGAYGRSLPQIVLKRRTLPWEREVDGRLTAQPATIPAHTPWLALVLLADGEGELRPNQPVAQCVTDGTVLEGRNDVDVGTTLVVTDEVIRKIFPAQDELALLTHVREVNLQDTELMMGDDDAWLAVVVANRLPQAGVRYRACLVSVEGQYHRLPTSHDVENEYSGTFAVPDWAERYAAHIATLHHAARDARGAGSVLSEVVDRGRGSASHAPDDAWAGAGAGPDARYVEANSSPMFGVAAQPGLHRIDFGILFPGLSERRFPVLAHWTFTCTDANDFESRMRALHVGMVGTIVPPPVAVAGQKPPPPAKTPPEVLDTGHLALHATSRGGDASKVWYRGPLTPRIIERTVRDAAGNIPLVHVSDQAWGLGPDGRDDASLASAFEIGRLLALADPTFVAAILLWRKSGFELARRQLLFDADVLLRAFVPRDLGRGFAFRVGRHVLRDLGADEAARLGALRPEINPAVPFERRGISDPITAIATGLGLERDQVDRLVAERPGASIDVGSEVLAPADLSTFDATVELRGLRDRLRADVRGVFELGRGRGGMDR